MVNALGDQLSTGILPLFSLATCLAFVIERTFMSRSVVIGVSAGTRISPRPDSYSRNPPTRILLKK